MSDQLGFESISADEFESATKREPKVRTPRAKKNPLDGERTRIAWFALQTQLGECNMSAHPDVIESLGLTAQEYRRVYPIRMVYKIDEERYMCRDCYFVEADKE